MAAKAKTSKPKKFSSKKKTSKVKAAVKAVKSKASSVVSRIVSGRSTAVPQLEKDVLSRKNADGTVVVMRLDNDRYFITIDGIAAEAWGLIDGKASLKNIKDKLIERHSPPARFEKDFSDLFQTLKKERLIRL